ncbi:MAG: OmpA family protein [Thermodesulfobacteriota bacterium]
MVRLKRVSLFLAGLAVLVMVLGAGMAQAETKLVPKVDNFILFIDDSGSMSMVHDKAGEVKAVLQKDFLLKLNEKIPNLDYQAGVFTFAPFAKKYPEYGVQKYDRAAVKKALSSLKTDQDIFGRLTPMGDGLSSLAPSVDQMAKRLAVIVLSDGKSNLGSDPVAEAKALYEKYPGNVCFHVVSFADEASGQKILDELAKLSGCTVKADGVALLKDEAALDKFVRDVFFDVVEVKAEKPMAQEKVEEVITFRGITFDFDSAKIRKDMAPILDEAVKIIKAKKGAKIVVEGHTCSIGADQYNQGLSERRAKAVQGYFAASGIDAANIEIIGYGESKPKYDNKTQEGRKLNRRVEIRFK